MLLGDCSKIENVDMLCNLARQNDEIYKDSIKIELMLTDPPYGVSLCDTKRAQEAQLGRRSPQQSIYFNIKNDNLKQNGIQSLLSDAIFAWNFYFGVKKYMLFSAGHIVPTMAQSLANNGVNFSHLLVWLKNHRVLSFGEFAYQSEFVLYGGTTDARHRNKNRIQSNIFHCPAVRAKRTECKWYHPTSKPVELLRNLLDSVTIAGDVICDPFAGTGSTMVAALRTGRRFLGGEINEFFFYSLLLRFLFETADQEPIFELSEDGGKRLVSKEEILQRWEATKPY